MITKYKMKWCALSSRMSNNRQITDVSPNAREHCKELYEAIRSRNDRWEQQEATEKV